MVSTVADRPLRHRRPARRPCSIAKAVGGGRVLFAGEHTRTDYPATVHGAYLSGRSSACAVLKSLGKTC
jgi:monoamine oxidase